MTNPSDSSYQTKVIERLLIEGASIKLDRNLQPQDISLEGTTHPVKVDGVCQSVHPPCLVEAYARKGKLRGAQPAKLARDILKLKLIKDCCTDFAEAKLYIVLSSQSTEEHIRGWLSFAADKYNVNFLVVDLDEERMKELLLTQERQNISKSDSGTTK